MMDSELVKLAEMCEFVSHRVPVQSAPCAEDDKVRWYHQHAGRTDMVFRVVNGIKEEWLACRFEVPCFSFYTFPSVVPEWIKNILF